MAKLNFFYGTMGAAKSAILLMNNFQLRERGIKTWLFTSSKDDRSGVGIIKSRIGIQEKAYPIYDSDNILQIINNKIEEEKSIPNKIFFDECQFLTENQVEDLAYIVDNLGIDVICYGLKTDFRTKMFSSSQRLMELSDVVQEIKTTCHCGRKSTMNARVKDGEIMRHGEQIFTGDTLASASQNNIYYVSICRKCWYENKIT